MTGSGLPSGKVALAISRSSMAKPLATLGAYSNAASATTISRTRRSDRAVKVAKL